MQTHFFYLARCADDSLYAGYTNDVLKREAAHNEGKGAKYTRGRGPIKIVYIESFADKSSALKREFEVKKFSKPQKEALLNKS